MVINNEYMFNLHVYSCDCRRSRRCSVIDLVGCDVAMDPDCVTLSLKLQLLHLVGNSRTFLSARYLIVFFLFTLLVCFLSSFFIPHIFTINCDP